MSERSLPDDQQMARVRLGEEGWRQFRTLALLKNRSVADYLGRLVQKELSRAQRTEERRAARQVEPVEPVEEAIDESWIPPWED